MRGGPQGQVAFVVPAFDEAETLPGVVSGLRRAWPDGEPLIIVVDDGSSDATAEVAGRAGARVTVHPVNRGKGAALLTGFSAAQELRADTVVTLDADGQHCAEDAVRLALDPAPRNALVLGVRDMQGAGAPKANQVSNKISNMFLSAFTFKRLRDTQCGVRRYPIPEVFSLRVGGKGFSFEAEVIVRASRSGWPIVQRPVSVHYPPPEARRTHFHVVRDPARIVGRVSVTLVDPRTFIGRGSGSQV